MCSSPSAPCECAPIDEDKNPAAQADANKKRVPVGLALDLDAMEVSKLHFLCS